MRARDERIAPEVLAAFLDGTLPEAERGAVLETLARSDVAYEQLLETSALVEGLRDESPPRGSAPDIDIVPPPPSPAQAPPANRFIRWRGPVLPLLAAAVLAAVALPSLLADRKERGHEALAALVTATEDRAPGALFGARWAEAVWSGTRGAAATLPASARAFRLGDRYAALTVALAAEQADAAGSIAAAIAEQAGDLPLGGPLAARVDALRNVAPATGIEALADMRAELRDLDGEPLWFDLGAWTAAARLAAAGDMAAFFEPGGPALRELEGLLDALGARGIDARPDAGRAIAALREIGQQQPGATSDLAPMQARLDSVTAALAR